MNNPGTVSKTTFQFPWLRQVRRDNSPLINRDAAKIPLQPSLAREAALQQEITDLVRRQNAQAEEFDHRFQNSIQMIVSLLSAQSRTASAEASAQLTIAANRIIAFGHVHSRLHLLDRQKYVEFKGYLEHLCQDLSSLLSRDLPTDAIAVEGTTCSIPTTLGSPLGFIVSELITNSAKHGRGKIVVRFETPSPYSHLITVVDDGPALAADFKLDGGKGLGLKIIQALVKEIGGELLIVRGEDRPRAAHFAISFRSSR
jgi:two-component system, sensor histidine kinase PdtaS